MDSGYEGLIFLARNWGLVTWLEEHWTENKVEEVIAAAKKAKFESAFVKHIRTLLTGPSAPVLWTLITKTEYDQGRVLVEKAAIVLHEILRKKQTVCSDLKNGNPYGSGSWFTVRPKFGHNSKGYLLTAGVWIEELARRQKNKRPEVCLLAELWLKSKAGVTEARTDRLLKRVVGTHRLLHKETEKIYPNDLIIGAASILGHTRDFRFDAESAIQKCLEPMRKLSPAHIKKLYDLAGDY